MMENLAVDLIGGVFAEFLLKVLFLMYPFFRIFKRAGLNSSLSFFLLIPYIGVFVCAIILGASSWKLNLSGVK